MFIKALKIIDTLHLIYPASYSIMKTPRLDSEKILGVGCVWEGEGPHLFIAGRTFYQPDPET